MKDLRLWTILSEAMVAVLTKQFPALSKFVVYDAISEELLRQLPTPALKELAIDLVNSDYVSIIAERYPQLEILKFSYGYCSARKMGLLSLCSGKMTQLRQLTLQSVALPDHACIALFSAAGAFPSLTHLTLILRKDPEDISNLPQYDNNHFLIFYYLMTSPFHQQLTYVQYGCAPNSENLAWKQGIAWNNVPTWTKLREVVFVDVPLFHLKEFFSVTPNLEIMNLGSLCDLFERKVDNTLVSCCDNRTIISAGSFSKSQKLQKLRFRWLPGMIFRNEIKLWKKILSACPPTMRLCEVFHADGRYYWDPQNPDHREIQWHFRTQIQLFA